MSKCPIVASTNVGSPDHKMKTDYRKLVLGFVQQEKHNESVKLQYAEVGGSCLFP